MRTPSERWGAAAAQDGGGQAEERQQARRLGSMDARRHSQLAQPGRVSEHAVGRALLCQRLLARGHPRTRVGGGRHQAQPDRRQLLGARVCAARHVPAPRCLHHPCRAPLPLVAGTHPPAARRGLQGRRRHVAACKAQPPPSLQQQGSAACPQEPGSVAERCGPRCYHRPCRSLASGPCSLHRPQRRQARRRLTAPQVATPRRLRHDG